MVKRVVDKRLMVQKPREELSDTCIRVTAPKSSSRRKITITLVWKGLSDLCKNGFWKPIKSNSSYLISEWEFIIVGPCLSLVLNAMLERSDLIRQNGQRMCMSMRKWECGGGCCWEWGTWMNESGKIKLKRRKMGSVAAAWLHVVPKSYSWLDASLLLRHNNILPLITMGDKADSHVYFRIGIRHCSIKGHILMLS